MATTTLGYEAMLAEIIRQDARKRDLVADTRRMSASVESSEAGNRLLVNIDRPEGSVETFALNPHARGQMANDLGIPKKYFDRMLADAPGLLAENANHWLANEPDRRLVRGFKPGDDSGGIGEGRAWLSDRYRRLDNIEVARKIFPIFQDIPGLQFHQAALTDLRFHLRVVLPSLTGEIKRGDVVQAGLEIKNSEVGASALVVQPYILRLICINEMTVAEYGHNRRHVGKRIEDEAIFSDEALAADDNAFWLVVRDSVKSVLTDLRFNEIVAALAETVHGEKIQAPIAATEELQSRFSLTDEERERVLTNLVADADFSQWGALNAITAAAKASDSFDRQAELEAIGWDVAQMDTKSWAAVAVAA